MDWEKMKKGSSYPDWFQESDWVKVKPRVPHFSGLMSSKLKLWIMLEVSSSPQVSTSREATQDLCPRAIKKIHGPLVLC